MSKQYMRAIVKRNWWFIVECEYEDAPLLDQFNLLMSCDIL
jgi:hypothetical protein